MPQIIFDFILFHKFSKFRSRSDASDSSDGLGSALPCLPACAGVGAQCDRSIASLHVAPAIVSESFLRARRAKSRRVSPNSSAKTNASASAICVRFGAVHTKDAKLSVDSAASPFAVSTSSFLSVHVEAVPRAVLNTANCTVASRRAAPPVCPAPLSSGTCFSATESEPASQSHASAASFAVVSNLKTALPAASADASRNNRAARPTVRVVVHPTRSASPAAAAVASGSHADATASTQRNTNALALLQPDAQHLEWQSTPAPPNMSNPPIRYALRHRTWRMFMRYILGP